MDWEPKDHVIGKDAVVVTYVTCASMVEEEVHAHGMDGRSLPPKKEVSHSQRK